MPANIRGLKHQHVKLPINLQVLAELRRATTSMAPSSTAGIQEHGQKGSQPSPAGICRDTPTTLNPKPQTPKP